MRPILSGMTPIEPASARHHIDHANEKSRPEWSGFFCFSQMLFYA